MESYLRDSTLEGKPLGFFTKDEMVEESKALIGPPSISTAQLNGVLRNLFERETTVRAAFLAEVHRQDGRAEVFLLLTVVVALVHQVGFAGPQDGGPAARLASQP